MNKLMGKFHSNIKCNRLLRLNCQQRRHLRGITKQALTITWIDNLQLNHDKYFATAHIYTASLVSASINLHNLE